MRLVQIEHATLGRRVAEVQGDTLRLVGSYRSIHSLAWEALEANKTLVQTVRDEMSNESLPYDPIYRGEHAWRLLAPIDYPEEPARCMVAGTGLTHMASAMARSSMHKSGTAPTADPAAPVTDSMKIFQWGVEGGRPAAGSVGVQPEWFYKGNGQVLRAPNQPLDVPAFADDGGEESEIAGVYLIDRHGTPRRLGYAAANEFSDHVMERKNYLYLAPSKLRTCSIGPELVVGEPDAFQDVRGRGSIERGGKVVWQAEVVTGEKNMSHTVANLEHHHFKYPEHRRPGDVHVHFFGAAKFSFSDAFALQDGDVMVVEFPGFGRALRNPIRIDRSQPKLAAAVPL
jgi:hypothetical protein